MKKKIGVGFGVMLSKGNSILLGRRHVDSEKASSELDGAGTWTMPGGKLHFGESFEEGGIREVLEETGILVKNLEIISVSNDMVEDAHFVTVGMLATDFKGDAQVLEPDEITQWEWFYMDNLPTPLYFPSARIIENYLTGKFYQSFSK